MTRDIYAGYEPLEGGEFHGYIPDFGNGSSGTVLDSLQAFGGFKQDLRIEYFIAWNTLRNNYFLPDVFLRQFVWGGAWPRNWRRHLRGVLKCDTFESTEGRHPASICSREKCLFHGLKIKREHFPAIGGTWGLLEEFAIGEGYERVYAVYDKSNAKLRKQVRKNRRLIKVYWPGLLFGPSRRVGWTNGQVRLLMGMVYELTRTPKRQRRGGEIAHVVRDGQVAPAGNHYRTMRCRLLNPGDDYVTFGGNGKYPGRGYALVGRTAKGWLYRAGHPPEQPRRVGRRPSDMITQFLSDLDALAEDLDLIPAAYHPQRKEWKGIHQLRHCLKSGFGQDWLEECRLRIYAPADWLIRWRYFFSQRMRFRWIPSSVDDEGPPRLDDIDDAPGQGTSGDDIRQLLREWGWSQQNLADALTELLGTTVSRRRVGRHIGGQSGTPEFFRAVEELCRQDSD